MIYLYIKTHNKTGLKYLGKTTNKNPYSYQGSGTYWKRHINTHGYDVTTQILLMTESKTEIKETGIFFSKLWNVVESNDWANLKEEAGDGGRERAHFDHADQADLDRHAISAERPELHGP